MGYNVDASGNRIVASPLTALGRESFKRTDDNSELMNIDGRPAGSTDVVWNGTGAGDTGGDWTRSGIGSESAASKKTGTNGLDTGVAALNDMCVFDNGSMIDVDGTYSALEFWMQLKAYPTGSRFRLRWVDSSNDLVGNSVLVSDYTSNMDVDVWQQVSIPVADFGLDGNVQKLQCRFRSAAGQHFWFDDFGLVNIAGGGGPYRFMIAAPAGELWHLSMAVLMVAAPSSGWNLNAFANISAGLSKGLIFRHRRISTSETLWRFVSKNNMELFGQLHPQEDVTFADGNLLVGFMVKPGKGNVVITDDDVLEVVVRDDLSDISEMRAYCHYGVEEVS